MKTVEWFEKYEKDMLRQIAVFKRNGKRIENLIFKVLLDKNDDVEEVLLTTKDENKHNYSSKINFFGISVKQYDFKIGE